ncbi:MAG: hypothetical protein Q4F11_10580, partial [Eubacteriales bacterium]|nr:hypothetical protein [Eubacteriales bacterium]
MVQLCSNRKKIKLLAEKIAFAFGLIFGMISIYACMSGRMYTITEEGKILISKLFHLYLVFGLISAAIIMFLCHLNKDKISRTIYFFIVFFAIVESVLLVLQMHNLNMFFSSVTYVLPFTLFYILLHSNPYDENSGCQNAHSFETRFLENVRYHRK